MKKVIEKSIDGVNIVSIPDDFIQCSVCGKFKDPTHYRKNNEKVQSRTNCFDCYNMEWEAMQKLKNDVKEKNSFANLSFQDRERINNFENEKEVESYSISVKELIDSLSKLDPNDRLVVTHEGYYAVGQCCEIFKDPPLIKNIEGVNYFKIGHSTQNY